jgi:hypothetical protein
MPHAKNMDVDVVITNNPAGGYKFELDANNGKGGVQEIKFENEHHPGIVIYFNIRDTANSGLTFQPVPGNAMWVKYAAPGDPQPPACPNKEATWNKFVPLSVEQDNQGNNTQLIVYYRNLLQQKFKFVLRFLDTDGAAVDYDPIGDGANGQ